MLTTNSTSNNRILEYIYEAFDVSGARIRKIIRDFHSEMVKGLSGKKSSLKMIPAFVDRPSQDEKGKFIALDLGGTNLRILELKLRGKGKVLTGAEKRFVLENGHTKGRREAFFDFISDCIKKFVDESKISIQEDISLGFTFSFPIKQTAIASGILLRWTKDFSVKDVVGREVVGLLRKSLIRKGLNNIKIAALVNDTVGTLVARSYADPNCDTAVILGTGTNACYRERISQIAKLKRHRDRLGHMIINIEWGNFNRLKLSAFDAELDNASANPGEQVLEKMVSGMYLGEITRLIFKDLVKRKILFARINSTILNRQGTFKTQYLSQIESDSSRKLSQTEELLKELGIQGSSIEERILIRKICKVVSTRGARISAAALAAVITKIDSRLSWKHTVAIDGSLYERHPGFARIIKAALKEIFGRKSSNIRLVLTKDGSGIGAAITAAAAVSQIHS